MFSLCLVTDAKMEKCSAAAELIAAQTPTGEVTDSHHLLPDTGSFLPLSCDCILMSLCAWLQM